VDGGYGGRNFIGDLSEETTTLCQCGAVRLGCQRVRVPRSFSRTFLKCGFYREKRRQIIRTPLDRGVGFLKQEKRLAAATRPDAEEVYSDAELLRLLHSNSQVLIAREQNCIAHGAIPGKVDHVSNDQG